MKPAVTTASVKLGTASARKSSIGAALRRACQTDAAAASRPNPISASGSSDERSSPPRRASPSTRLASASAVSTKPSASKGAFAIGARSGMWRSTSHTPASPSGTLIRKIQRHETWVTIIPPITGPITGAISPGQVIVAIASMMRSLGVSCSTTKRPTGDMNAAAAPCRMRAAISVQATAPIRRVARPA